MNFHFNDWLINKLLGYKESYPDFDFEVCVEQDFIKMSKYAPGKIYIVTKLLSDSKIFNNATTQPVQIMILCEENTQSVSQAIFSDLATAWNMKTFTEDGSFIKFTFTQPVVMSNFGEFFSGYRSILYMNCQLYIMTDVSDLISLTIDSESIDALSFNMSYTMTPDTQQIVNAATNKYIAKSVKSASGFTINFSMILKYDSAMLTKIFNILKEVNNGDDSFSVVAKIGKSTTECVEITKTMKLTASTIVTAPNEIGTIQIGFIE